LHQNPGLASLPVLNSNDYPDRIPVVTLREVAEEIRTVLNPKKASRFNVIASEILKNFKRRALVKLTTLINASNRRSYMRKARKTAEVIMMPKPGKNLSEVESYRPISLLSLMLKLLENLILQRLEAISEEKHLVPTHQFGFRKNRSTTDQVHHITDTTEEML
jgi:hypothetical protein